MISSSVSVTTGDSAVAVISSSVPRIGCMLPTSLSCTGSAVLRAEDETAAPPPLEIVISVAEQKLALDDTGPITAVGVVARGLF